NSILRVIVKQVTGSLPQLTNLRVLEVGGGQGLATRELLPLLPSKQTNYTFTDVGGYFLNSGKKKFSGYPFIDYRFLDIEQPPSEQGYESHSFDVVIAANVLHVTKNMDATLHHVRSLLAPNGLLLILEITEAALDFDITWGLLMNPLEDEERSLGNPFLSKQQWREVLLRHGFVEVAAFPEGESLGQHILVGQASMPDTLSAPAAFTVPLDYKDTAGPNSQALLDKNPDMAEWFYVPSWKRSTTPLPFAAKEQASQPECWLVFVDEWGLGAQILKRLELEGHDVVTVRIGDQFSGNNKLAQSQLAYTINPQQRDDYDALFKELLALGLRPTRVLHFWNVTSHEKTESGLAAIDQAQAKGFYSLLFLVQALSTQNLVDELQVTVISNNLQSVTGEELLSPEKATLLGAVRVIPLEYPNIRCRSIDVLLSEGGSWQVENLVENLFAEFSVNTPEPIIAYRGMHRWTLTIEQVRLDEAFEGISRLREGGVYLITGGLGTIGLALASYLAQTVQAKLVLTGRSAFPAKDEWETWLNSHEEDDEVSDKIGRLKKLEKLGAEILIAQADVADLEAMQQVIARTQERFGQINGVIHAAGILGDGVIGRKARKDAESVLLPKVRGTLVLDEVLKTFELDFWILCSSRASVTPLAGQMSYSSANNFLDVFAHHETVRDGTFTISINWGSWLGSGMAVEAAKKLAQTQLPQTDSDDWDKDSAAPISKFKVDFLKDGVFISEGIEVFKRILGSNLSQVIVSASDLIAQINDESIYRTLSNIEAVEEPSSGLSTHPRPDLNNAYVAPRNEIEKMLIDIWQEVLGIGQIGIYDNFFELGGDSLLATQVISRANKTFHAELSVNSMFEIPTVADISEQIKNIRLTTQKQQDFTDATLGKRDEGVL
ncbi:MAG: SDR family NAD(P)-dependent oxidoreductase, partial [Leptolyngbya sp. SIO1D8]|nr:SDR family NAD(P)-dependent oxidoreductase [Leptolyngbya sp. SIO1D8]